MIKSITNKKGSHVGVVVSFVIFITFLVFLYSIIQPATVRERDKNYILDYLTFNLLGNTSIETSNLIIYVEDLQVGKDCVNIQQLDLEQIPLGLRGYMIFKNSSGDLLDYWQQNDNTLLIKTGEGFQGIINVQAIMGIDAQNDTSFGGCDPHSVPMGNLKIDTEIFEGKIYELNETYYADYEGLKAHFGIPLGAEFNFYVYDGARSEPPIVKAEIQPSPTDRSVFTEETPIQYVDESGNTLFGFLKIEVW